jgi:hypothetical protein
VTSVAVSFFAIEVARRRVGAVSVCGRRRRTLGSLGFVAVENLRVIRSESVSELGDIYGLQSSFPGGLLVGSKTVFKAKLGSKLKL